MNRPGMTLLKRPSTADQVHDILRDRIVSLELKPHELLSRADLATSFGVSQTPVRDALLRLEATGLVRIYPQSRTVVAPIDPNKIMEVRFFRRGLELEAALTVTENLTPAGLAELQAIQDQQTVVSSDDSKLMTFMALDKSFHQTLFRLAGQSDLHQLVLERSVHLDRIRMLQLPLQGKRLLILREHQGIIDAMASRDLMAVTQAVRTHITGTGNTLDDLLKLHPSYF
jgi:DNA-binding GntR family transcriptional regulator